MVLDHVTAVKKFLKKNGKLPAAYDKAVRRVKCGMMLLQV